MANKKNTMTFNAIVDRWIDGDTVDLRVDLGFSIWSKQRVRLAEINTPEKGQPLYVEASEKARELAPVGGACLLYSHGKDKYGRYIGEIHMGGVNVNEELVKLGLAKEYE
jgi:micrococcal nuclease